MTADAGLLIALGFGALFILWGWRRIGAVTSGFNQHSHSPVEPCWTEEIGHDGRYRYGRYRCVNDDLLDADRRAAGGEFQMPYCG